MLDLALRSSPQRALLLLVARGWSRVEYQCRCEPREERREMRSPFLVSDHAMASASGYPTARVPGNPATRWALSKVTRRAVWRTAALTDELKMHSFRIHVDGTVTWTLRHERDAPARKPATDSQNREPSARTQKSRERAATHQALQEKAERTRAAFILRRWDRGGTISLAPMKLC